MSESNRKEVIYSHVSLTGTSYEIGKKVAEIMEKYYPEEIDFYLKGNDIVKSVSKDRIKEAIKTFDQYCPNINEEINGFADYFGCSPEDIIYYSFSCVS